MSRFPPSVSPDTFTNSAIIIGLILCQELDINEQGALGQWLTLVGEILFTNAAQVTLLNARENNTKPSKNDETDKYSNLLKKFKDALDQVSNE